MSTTPRFDPASIPARMRGLRLDHRGFPVPWFVQWIAYGLNSTEADPHAAPDFRIIDGHKMLRAVKERRCWLCGQPLGRYLAFVIGPMCAINRVTSEPPSHRECAEFAMHACPFLARPRMRRNEHDMPPHQPVVGIHLDHNPGVMALWIATHYQPVRAHVGSDGVLFKLGEPVGVHWYTEGRTAKPAEIAAAVDKGLPFLREVAEREGNGAEAALNREIERFRATILPAG